MKRKTIVWGSLLILAGVLVALCTLGVIEIPMGISPWRIILGVGVLFVLVEGLSRLEFAQTFVMAGVEVILFEAQIGTLIGKTEENWINNWIVLLIAALIGAGLDMIFSGVKHKFKIKKGKHFGVQVNAFSDNLKYIDASKMGQEYARNRFGDFEIRFENSDDYKGGGELTVDNSFGDMTIYVPADWEVSVNVDNSFGDVTVDSALGVAYADGSNRKLAIKGTNRFGDMDIRAQK